MKVHHLRRVVLAILTSVPLLLGSTGPVGAQQAGRTGPAPIARSFDELKSRIQPGATIYVIDSAGHEVSGKLTALSDASLSLLLHGKPQAFSHADVALVRQRQSDPLWNGLFIGGAAGAVPAVYWLFADPNECGGSICMSDLLIGAVQGAAIGLAIDALVRGKVIVYRPSSPSSMRTAFTVGPAVAQRRKGVQLSISF